MLAAIERFQVNRINGWGDMLPTLRHAAIARGIDVDAIVGPGLFRDQSGEIITPHLQANLLGIRQTYAVHLAEPLNTALPHRTARPPGRPSHAPATSHVTL